MMRKALQDSKSPGRMRDTPHSVIAPIGGLNSRDPLSAMKPQDALILENWICRPTSLQLRKGQANFVTGFGAAPVRTLMAYKAAPTDKLFAATDSGIYDVTTAGVVGAALIPCTNGRWEYMNGSNAGIRYLLAVNGTDKMKFYNGAVWADAAITGISDSAKFTNITQFKFRVLFTEKDTLSFWYLGVNAVQGLATEFPLAPLFQKGGSLQAIGDWTIDGGNGQDDYLCLLTSEGELAVYKGIDPSDASNFSLVGVYSVPKPIGRKCLFKFGGDLIILTESGLVKLSNILQVVSVDRTSSISDKIIGELSAMALLYKANHGWCMMQFSTETILVVNVPIVEGGTAVQYVMNTLTGAWSKFTAMNACCFQEMGSRLFYGMAGKVVQALTGTADFGNNITLKSMSAYNNFGLPLNTKKVSLARLNLRTTKALALGLGIGVNYEASPYLAQAISTTSGQSLFDVARWDEAVWAGTSFTVAQWRSISHKAGYTLSQVLQIADKGYELEWFSSDYLIELGSTFG